MSNIDLHFQARLFGSHIGNKIVFTDAKSVQRTALLAGVSIQRTNVSARLLLWTRGSNTPLLAEQRKCQLLLKPIESISLKDIKDLCLVERKRKSPKKVKLYKGFFVNTPTIFRDLDGIYDSILMCLTYPLVAPQYVIDCLRANGVDCGFEGVSQLIGTDYARAAKTAKAND